MPDDLTDDFDQDDPSDSNAVKQLRRQAREQRAELKELREQAALAQAAQRKLHFAEAGVPLDDPRAKYFVNGYDGEFTADAIKSAYHEYAGVAPTPKQDLTPEIDAMNRITQAGASATPEENMAEHQRYLAELDALANGPIRDQTVLQQEALKIMDKYHVGTTRNDFAPPA